MKILDFNQITAFPYEERQKNVLFNTDEFKIRIIELAAGASMPECNMESYVVFHVIGGEVDVTVNGEVRSLGKNQSLVSEPGTFSMKTQNGFKIMGIQIKKKL